MSRSTGLSSFAANFEPKVAAPLDARTIVSYLTDLSASATWNTGDGNAYVYVGMPVAVINDGSNNGIYWLKNSDYTLISNWEKVGDSSVFTNQLVAVSGNLYTTIQDTSAYLHDQITTLTANTSSGYNYLWIPANEMIPQSSISGAISNRAYNNIAWRTNIFSTMESYSFSKNTEKSVVFNTTLSNNWNADNIELTLYWTSESTETSEGVAWGVNAKAIGVNELIDDIYVNDHIIYDTLLNANYLHTTSNTTITPEGTLDIKTLLNFKITRKVNDINDTITNDVKLIGAMIKYFETSIHAGGGGNGNVVSITGNYATLNELVSVSGALYSLIQNSSGASITGNYLNLDQTIPQTIINGSPTFNSGIIVGDIIPITGDTYSLGTSELPFKELYLTGISGTLQYNINNTNWASWIGI